MIYISKQWRHTRAYKQTRGGDTSTENSWITHVTQLGRQISLILIITCTLPTKEMATCTVAFYQSVFHVRL